MLSRIKAIIAQQGLSTRAFALRCGLRQNTLSNQLNGIRELSLSTIMAILESFPEISAEWLMRGVGEMINKPSSGLNSEQILRLADTIAMMQETLNEKQDTIASLSERIKQLENQLKSK